MNASIPMAVVTLGAAVRAPRAVFVPGGLVVGRPHDAHAAFADDAQKPEAVRSLGLRRSSASCIFA